MKEERARRFLQSAKAALKKSFERDRSVERYIAAFSRLIWPWRESWLLVVVGSVCILDYMSTFSALALSGKDHVYENGPLAGWALQTGGFVLLFFVDLAAAGVLSLVAISARFLYGKYGFKGFGRTAFVVLLEPYVVITAVAITNNFVLTLR